MLAKAAAVLVLSGADALSLPSVHASAEAPRDASWAVTVGDTLYHAPPTALVELSQDVSHYYYALGSSSALTSEMKQRRVGGEGRWHLFHLPEGPSMLQLPNNNRGDRRAAFSSFIQLQHGTVLPKDFPKYVLLSTEVDRRSDQTKVLEQNSASVITPELYEDFLKRLVSLSDNGVATRSYENAAASTHAADFLKQEFEKMGYTTCMQNFKANGIDLINVIAHLPGSTPGKTLTVGAHYDSRPFEAAAPGAEDNGSGVAAMLAVAKAFAEGKLKPERSTYFVGFAAEEVGMLGSAEFAKALTSGGLPAECKDAASSPPSFLQRMKRDTRHAAIALDEIGWKSPSMEVPTINLESYDWTRELMTHLYQSNQMHNGDGLNVVHSSNPFGSDHMSFLDRDVPGVLVINGDDESYPNYHQSTDTIDNVDMKYASNVTKMVFGGAVRMAGVKP